MILESFARRSRIEKIAFARRLRENPTKAEAILWTRLRRGRTGFYFRRQKILRGYIVDFLCTSARIIIEVDGEIHETPERIAADHRRERILTRAGFKILRVRNEDVLEEIEGVVAWIEKKIRERVDLRLRDRGTVGHPRRAAFGDGFRDDSGISPPRGAR